MEKVSDNMTSKTIGKYTVVVEKLDECPCKYEDIIEILGLLDMIMIPAIGLVIAVNLSSVELAGIAIAAPFLWIGAVSKFSNHLRGCGCKISLYGMGGEKRNYYQFTDNPNTDVAEVQKIVDRYTAIANTQHANDIALANKTADKRKDCCTRYNGIMEKVKYE